MKLLQNRDIEVTRATSVHAGPNYNSASSMYTPIMAAKVEDEDSVDRRKLRGLSNFLSAPSMSRGINVENVDTSQDAMETNPDILLVD